MPVYSQGEDYDEEETAEETKAEPETEEEPEEKPKKKKTKERDLNTNIKLVACVIGITAAACLVGVAAIAMDSKHKQSVAEDLADKQFEQLKADFANGGPGEPTDEPTEETVAQPVSEVSYSKSELKALRKWGYTASEIELASRDGLSPEALVESARADREEAQKEALAEVSDTASDAYKKLLNQTWLGGEDLDVSAFDSNLVLSRDSRVEIADYEKCDPHGEQCFIKVYLDDGNAAFMTVTPMRFNELSDSGNIVVEITSITIDDVTVIVNIEEQRVN